MFSLLYHYFSYTVISQKSRYIWIFIWIYFVYNYIYLYMFIYILIWNIFYRDWWRNQSCWERSEASSGRHIDTTNALQHLKREVDCSLCIVFKPIKPTLNQICNLDYYVNF